MAKIKFIFLNRFIPLVGGIMPPEAETLNVYENYYLAEIDSSKFHKIKYWEPMPVDDEVAEGFKFLGQDEYAEITFDETTGEEKITTRPFTDEELRLKTKAEKALKKLEIRYKISAEVNDIYDIVADLWKRVTLNERLLLRLSKFIMDNNTNLPEKLSSYKTMVEQAISDIDAGNYKDRTDLEDPSIIYTKLKERGNKITQLIEEYINYPSTTNTETNNSTNTNSTNTSTETNNSTNTNSTNETT